MNIWVTYLRDLSVLEGQAVIRGKMVIEDRTHAGAGFGDLSKLDVAF